MNSYDKKQFEEHSYKFFLSLDDEFRAEIIRSILYQVKHKNIRVGYCYNPEHLVGGKQYLIRNGIITFPPDTLDIRDAILCEGYVINEKYEVIKSIKDKL